MAKEINSTATHRVSIVNQGGDYFVTPRAQHVTSGETVTFALAGPVGTTHLLFPNPDLFGVERETLDTDRDSLELTAQDVASGVYPFAVYNEKTKQFVRATPDPVIIMD